MTLAYDEVTAASAEAGEACSLENYLALPDHSMDGRIAQARARLGQTTVILGHHYQRDEVVRFADFTGDSLKLSKTAASTAAKYIVFCGVHFMAESADILAREGQQVILPDMNAGCSMADMAEISQVEDCWDALERAGLAGETIPITYINSTAAIKAFCGEHGGLVCTSSSARAAAVEWGFKRAKRILFLPDQHLGRNTAYAMGIPLDEMAVWDSWAPQLGSLQGGQTKERLAASRMLLWKGHCAVHQRFLPSHVDRCGRSIPASRSSSIPSAAGRCAKRRMRWARRNGSSSSWSRRRRARMFAIGTEIHLVNRLARRFAPKGKKIVTLDDTGCLCTTMYRISPQHLAWALENLVEGRVVNRIKVRDDVKYWARVALDRMIEAGNRQ